MSESNDVVKQIRRAHVCHWIAQEQNSADWVIRQKTEVGYLQDGSLGYNITQI